MQEDDLAEIQDNHLENEAQSEETVENLRPKREWRQIWENLVRLGLGEASLRLGTSLLSIVLVLAVVTVMRHFYLDEEVTLSPQPMVGAVQAATGPTPEPPPSLPELAMPDGGAYRDGLVRLVKMNTILPTQPRLEVSQYEVQVGDSVFEIAKKFNLNPETILWGNYYVLADDVHRLQPGQTLNILPVDGVYYEWHAGDGLNGVAEFYDVSVDNILDWTSNDLDRNTIGDYANPNIAPGTWLVIPGGVRDFVSWSAPRITRDDPAVAKTFGPGFCGEIMEGPVGNGTFVWPSVERYLSGYDYSPETNHFGIDIAGATGYALFSVDAGVVVYAGWNDWGYGNTVVIDHGNGWQSLYAHMDSLNVGCGSFVYQGDVIGAMGNTGNSSGAHLHFELRSDLYGKVNPWNFLQ
ncbi:MAG: peptidoglycan DD-metalloendopeptidase family protein [Anaerolineaceae bacterium]|jgi:LysM repeat protein|nr:peptidoglycan DD-metalloendopeptidase family protein [Anaerolineaceae bacterium]